MRTAVLPLLLALSLLLSLISCTGSGRLPESSISSARLRPSLPRHLPGGFSLPDPQQILSKLPPAARRGSYIPDDLIRNGEAFLPDLKVNVSASANGAVFVPQPPQKGLNGLAYALYSLAPQDYDGQPIIHLDWNTLPASLADVTVLAVNFDTNRWEAFSLDVNLNVNLPALDPFQGEDFVTLIAVLVGGSAPVDLNFVRLGSQAPIPVVSASPSFTFTPAHVDFDASASFDDDGTIVEYLWDIEGFGTFTSSGNSPLFGFDYTFRPDQPARLRVVDDTGVYSETTIPITLGKTTIFSYGTDKTEEINSVLTGPTGTLFLFGSRKDVNRDVLFGRTGPDGATFAPLLWGGDQTDEIKDAAFAPDDRIYAVGSTFSFGSDEEALLQRWTTGGELELSRSINVPGNLIGFNTVAVGNNIIYGAGAFVDPGLGQQFGLIMALDNLGNVQWIHTLIGADDTQFLDMVIRPQTFTDPAELDVCGYYGPASGERDALFARYGLDGSLLSAQTWGEAGRDESANHAALAGLAVLPVVWVGGDIDSDRAFASIPGGGAISYGIPGQNIGCVGLLRRSNSSVNLAFKAFGVSSEQILILGVQNDFTTAPFSGTSFHTDLGVASPRAFAPCGGGAVLAGVTSHTLPVQDDSLGFGSHSETAVWTAISPAQGSPNTAVSDDTTLTVSTGNGFTRNRENTDSDALAIVFKPQ